MNFLIKALLYLYGNCETGESEKIFEMMIEKDKN